MGIDKKKRLMEAAMAFVVEGESPTTRQLVARAGVNIAAINYYFQGKDNLMAEALDQAALGDLERWIADNAESSADGHAALLNFVRFLARIHFKFWTVSKAQLENITLKGKEERATARALTELRRLCGLIYEGKGWDAETRAYRARVAAVSLMSSLHYVSIFHPYFESMADVELNDEASLYRYVDELLRPLGLLGEELQ